MMEETPEITQKILPKIRKQTDRLAAIISDLLDISKIQAGKFELSKTITSLITLIKESVEAAKQLSAAHEIECRLPNEDLMLDIDSTKMSQVLINILSNAIKYSPQNKKIMVEAERIGDEVKIGIHDRGIGVATEHLDKIFTQFYRVATDENRTAGLGLGLYLCKEFVEAHHGKIWAESEIGKGTIIHLILPVKLIKT
jgi:signal transduction histidine kinase